MSTQSNLHVVFGSGPLGLSVVDALLARGLPVRVVNRSGKAAVPAQVQVIAADAYNQQQTRLACQGAAVVYQCAQPPYQKWVDLFPVLQANILSAAGESGAKLIVGDNLYMYGQVDGPIHEDLPYQAVTRKGKTRALMAEAVLAAHKAGQVQAAIGRGSDFFGPRVLGSTLGERIFSPALTGKAASAMGSLDQPHTFTYIKDFGKALVTLAENEQALGQVWHVPSPKAVTQREVISLIYEEAGHPPKMSAMGRFMLAIGGLFIPEARESIEMMYQFEQPFVMDDRKFVQAFGAPATPLRDAVRATLAWYRQQQQAQGQSVNGLSTRSSNT